MPVLTGFVERRVAETVRSRLTVDPVIVLEGPRSVGKSTLLRTLADSLGKEIVDLDDLATRAAVRADPTRFVEGDEPVLIDEFQHVPELLDVIKAELNRDGSPGRYVITGSTRYNTLPIAAQALTGRANRIQILPLSQGEIAGARETFAQRLLEDPATLLGRRERADRREEYIDRVLAGGFPLALRRSTHVDRARWFDDYAELVVERDALEISRIRQRQALPALLRRLANQTGQVLNIAAAAQAVGIEKSTAESYTKLLEAVFLIQRLPAWGRTLGSRVGAAPKVHLLDSGLAARLLQLTEAKLSERSASALSAFGHLLETFAIGEVCRQLDWLDAPTHIGHWRTHDGQEVDLIVEREDGRVVGIEVKAGSSLTGDGLSGLRALRRKLGGQMLGTIVLYTGPHAYAHPEGHLVLPLSRVWSG